MTTTDVVSVLDRAGAMELTERIRAAVHDVWRLLFQAHERQAWRALGYNGFRAYLDAEFDLSQSQAYRLIAKAVVVRELANIVAPAATGQELAAVEAAVAAEVPAESAKKIRAEMPAVRRTAKRVAKRAVAAGASPAVAAADGARAAIASLLTFKAPGAPGDDEDRVRRAAEYAARTGRPAQQLIRHCATCTCGAR